MILSQFKRKKKKNLGLFVLTSLLLINFALIFSIDHPHSVSQTNLIESIFFSNSDWIINPQQAKSLISTGSSLLDARGSTWLPRESIKGAILVNWQDFSEEADSEKGKLLKNSMILAEKIRKLGISQDKPVVVFADSLYGWGEDGRLVWMLRTLGHPKTVLVDGGYDALIKAGLPTGKAENNASKLGDFTPKRSEKWAINKEEVEKILSNPNWVIIDVREDREFKGKTPYGETREGHIPSAIHFYYRNLLDSKGHILPRHVIVNKFQALGISQRSPIVAYCTAGVRSAWFTSVLTDSGFTAKNYAGSMLEWSAAPSSDYPMVKERYLGF